MSVESPYITAEHHKNILLRYVSYKDISLFLIKLLILAFFGFMLNHKNYSDLYE